MSYFDKANRTVTRRSYGTSFGKEIDRKDLIPVKDRSNRKSVMENSQHLLNEDLEKKVRDSKLQNYRDEKEKSLKLNEGYEALKENLIKDIMREICVGSLLVDEEPVIENLNTIFNLVDEQVEKIGGFNGVKRISKDLKNPLLIEMVNICETTAKEVAERVLTEENYSFNMNDKENELFDYRKQEIGVDTVIDVVKNKVLDVVKIEQKRSQEVDELMTEIKEKINEIEAPVEEAMEYIFGNNGLEEVTLFNSMMRKSYKGILENSVSTIYESDCAKDNITIDYDYNIDDIDIEIDGYDDYTYSKLSQTNNVIDNVKDEEDDDEEIEDLMLKENSVGLLEGDAGSLATKLANAADTAICDAVFKIAYKDPSKIDTAIKSIRAQLNSHKHLLKQVEKELASENKNVAQKILPASLILPVKNNIKTYEVQIKSLEKRKQELNKKLKESSDVIMNKFMEIGESIIESINNLDDEIYGSQLNDLLTVIEESTDNCIDPIKASVSKSLIRQIQVSTEELTEGCKGSKGKEITNPDVEGDVVMELDEKQPKENNKNEKYPKTSADDVAGDVVAEGFNDRVKSFFEKQNDKFIAKRDFESIRESMIKFVKEAESIEDLNTLDSNYKANIVQLNQAKLQYPDASEKITEHIEWLNNNYDNLLENRKKEIKIVKVTEAFSVKIDNICDKLDEMIDLHENALSEATNSMNSEYEGNNIILPLIESLDYNKSNIDFVYKVKLVCESLRDLVENIENETDAVQLQEMVELNIASINSTKSMLNGKEEVSEYKLNILESARLYLENINDVISDIRNNMDDRITYEEINEAKTFVDSLYDKKRNMSLLEYTNNERMELVMAEAITNYTILEAFNTLHLIYFDKESVRQMARNNIR